MRTARTRRPSVAVELKTSLRLIRLASGSSSASGSGRNARLVADASSARQLCCLLAFRRASRLCRPSRQPPESPLRGRKTGRQSRPPREARAAPYGSRGDSCVTLTRPVGIGGLRLPGSESSLRCGVTGPKATTAACLGRWPKARPCIALGLGSARPKAGNCSALGKVPKTALHRLGPRAVVPPGAARV